MPVLFRGQLIGLFTPCTHQCVPFCCGAKGSILSSQQKLLGLNQPNSHLHNLQRGLVGRSAVYIGRKIFARLGYVTVSGREDERGTGEQDALRAIGSPLSPYLGCLSTSVFVTVNEARKYLAINIDGVLQSDVSETVFASIFMADVGCTFTHIWLSGIRHSNPDDGDTFRNDGLQFLTDTSDRSTSKPALHSVAVKACSVILLPTFSSKVHFSNDGGNRQP